MFTKIETCCVIDPQTRDDVIQWKHFPGYWPFVRGIHRSPVNSPHQGQWHGAFIFSLICVGANDQTNSRNAGASIRHHGHYNVTVILLLAIRLSHIVSQICSIQWRHNERDNVSNYRRLDCLLNLCSVADQRKQQNSASLPFVRGIHRRPVNSPHKGPVTRKTFPCEDVIM